MSLVSASGIIGGIKEYTFRGIQQLPLILTATSLLYTITTASIVHTNLTMGLALIIPAYTMLLQSLIGFVMNWLYPTSISWKRSTGDTCDLIPGHEQSKLRRYAEYDKSLGDATSVPSFWLMSVAFFIGYTISNAVDTLMAPAAPSGNEDGREKRNTQAVFILVASVVFSVVLLIARVSYMSSCEGRGTTGLVLSTVSATGAATIGYGLYIFSKSCGARSSDLFGVLSQILPASATSPNPIVCAAS
jgi:hypothetical protein